jgi:hypothetical protein
MPPLFPITRKPIPLPVPTVIELQRRGWTTGDFETFNRLVEQGMDAEEAIEALSEQHAPVVRPIILPKGAGNMARGKKIPTGDSI